MTPYLAFLLLASPAPDAQPAPRAPPVCPSQASVRPAARITKPEWINLPSGDDEMYYYPRYEMNAGVEGHVTMKCSVTVDGLLKDCSIVRERPPRKGFGSATLHLASRFRMKPCTPAGLHVTGASVVIPVHWVFLEVSVSQSVLRWGRHDWSSASDPVVRRIRFCPAVAERHHQSGLGETAQWQRSRELLSAPGAAGRRRRSHGHGMHGQGRRHAHRLPHRQRDAVGHGLRRGRTQARLAIQAAAADDGRAPGGRRQGDDPDCLERRGRAATASARSTENRHAAHDRVARHRRRGAERKSGMGRNADRRGHRPRTPRLGTRAQRDGCHDLQCRRPRIAERLRGRQRKLRRVRQRGALSVVPL